MAHHVIKILMAFTCQAVLAQAVFAQNTFKVVVTDSVNGEKVPMATVLLKAPDRNVFTDTAGYAGIKDVPDGDQTFKVSYLGYNTKSVTVHFPRAANEPYKISLTPAQHIPGSYPLIGNKNGNPQK